MKSVDVRYKGIDFTVVGNWRDDMLEDYYIHIGETEVFNVLSDKVIEAIIDIAEDQIREELKGGLI